MRFRIFYPLLCAAIPCMIAVLLGSPIQRQAVPAASPAALPASAMDWG